MKVTVLGVILIVAAVIAAVLLVRHLTAENKRSRPPQGQMPGQ
jgi:hypothetical protein